MNILNSSIEKISSQLEISINGNLFTIECKEKCIYLHKVEYAEAEGKRVCFFVIDKEGNTLISLVYK